MGRHFDQEYQKWVDDDTTETGSGMPQDTPQQDMNLAGMVNQPAPPPPKALSEIKDEQLSEFSGQQQVAEQAKGDAESRIYMELQNKLKGLGDQAAGQAASAQATYQNTILPNMKNYMDSARKEANSAMTLQQSMDPNNTVASSFRNFYDQRAQNEGQRGLADVGIMQAMGTQALGNQLGSGQPVTGAQMQLLQSGFQSQAGQAFSNVQKRMQSLRDQGIEQGWNQTDKAYDRGQGARDRYGSSIQMQSGLEDAYTGRMGGLRAEMAGYGQGASEAGLSGLSSMYDPQIRGVQRKTAVRTGTFDTQMQQQADQLAQSEARKNARMQANASQNAAMISAAGSVAGSALGGPMGGAAGGMLAGYLAKGATK